MAAKRSVSELKEFLDGKVLQYNKPEFISTDPISIPHLFRNKEDIEISGFFAATIAWGQRPTILKNAPKLIHWMDDAPHDFILNHKDDDLAPFKKFVHRTFHGEDTIYFIKAFQHIYRHHGGLESVFHQALKKDSADLKEAIVQSRNLFFKLPHLKRTEKHFSNPAEGSAAKRINMFLRWMVRKDKNGIDFGIWKNISPSLLSCPLDVHSGRVARKLRLLKRKQNDWKATEELTNNLRKLDANDPVKYDFALFGLGVFEKF